MPLTRYRRNGAEMQLEKSWGFLLHDQPQAIELVGRLICGLAHHRGSGDDSALLFVNHAPRGPHLLQIYRNTNWPAAGRVSTGHRGLSHKSVGNRNENCCIQIGFDINCMSVIIQSKCAMGTPNLLHFQINPHSGVPVYRQMMDQVKYYVASGVLRAGDQLPSIRELAQRLAVNPTTVVKTYCELEHEQVIEMRHGKGAFVAESGARLSAKEREQALRRLARQLIVEAKQMGAAKETLMRVVKDEMEDILGPE